ncbi:Pseudouridine-metabolizing bifunctional protein C1861.05 [Araneus ventricosus]|uniref:Pseudouridine-metabolizing bifunctional protein C1861.05 n=1 Tax=Araneus ventricosus TaxID=182803 RepID=A0A4Y2HNJ3_ARAVE|nr:Pseudouridine-metabolizing bifunctional protein C1861.05 [Araneus ventricosus]
MALAYRSGISVFATGGIGGVHRGGETTMDVSADLFELSKTPIAVVSAGVKSILDIGRTLEYLETLGVCVAAFGASKDFPAFFMPKSNFKAPCNVESYEEAARLIVYMKTGGKMVLLACKSKILVNQNYSLDSRWSGSLVLYSRLDATEAPPCMWTWCTLNLPS